MALVEVYISNGEPNQSVAIKDGVSHDITMTPSELDDLNAAISLLQTEDITNFGWLIENDIPGGMFLKHPSIDGNVTCCDKGGNVGVDEPAYTSLSDLVTSILNRI